MKFTPNNEAMASSLSADSRSILRVPSLNSSISISTRTAALSDQNERSVGIVDYTGSPLHHHSGQKHPVAANKFIVGEQHGPPAYVNYRPEEMNLTPLGWQLSSKYNAQRNWAGGHLTVPSRLVGESGQIMSTYSPIRIRSSRGARRHSLGSVRPISSNVSLANMSPTNESSETPSRGFPVSNRGMGRRRIVAATNSKGHTNESTNDEVLMLAETKSFNSPTTNETTEINVETKFPRSVLKRKLPLMASINEAANDVD
jgi:hypothetical protein